MTEEFRTVLSQARQLSAVEKIRLVEHILPEVENALSNRTSLPRREWKGVFRDTGPVPSEEDIEKMRREVWPQS
jgi:hypothetical protein